MCGSGAAMVWKRSGSRIGGVSGRRRREAKALAERPIVLAE